ncbi:uncharacterized protein LOC144902415 [Branchiostoma floridae x Branchiostoma belcheri]
MAEKFKPKKIRIGTDLIKAAKYQLGFLKEVDRHPMLYEGPHVDNALRRYEKLWLPLVARVGTKGLSPPLDIHWVWHVHMLAPLHYEADCNNIVGKLIDHHIPDNIPSFRKGLQAAQSQWEKEYPSESFDVDLNSPPPSKVVVASPDSQISYDLRSAISRQRMFYYQVSLPHFRDDKFLQEAVLRYKMLLHLKKTNPGKFLVPCYDMDLIWHAHQINPVIYKSDTEAILGKTFNHDDSVNDRSPGSKLNTSDDQTRTLWKTTFGKDFPLSGAMFRGPPPGDVHRMTREEVFAITVKRCNIIVERAEVQNIPSDMIRPLCLKIRSKKGSVSLKQTPSDGRLTWSSQSTSGLKTFDWGDSTHLCARLTNATTCQCLAGEPLSSHDFDLRQAVHGVPESGTQIVVRSERTDLPITLTVGIVPREWGEVRLTTNFGTWAKSPLSGDYLSTLPPMVLGSDGAAYTFEIATHNILDLTGGLAFRCRVVHSAELKTSVVQVMTPGDQLTAEAYLIRNDTVPTPGQLQAPDVVPTMGPNDCAMLIRNGQDWGVVVGRWDNFRQGVPGTPGVKGVSGTQDTPAVKGVKGTPGYGAGLATCPSASTTCRLAPRRKPRRLQATTSPSGSGTSPWTYGPAR